MCEGNVRPIVIVTGANTGIGFHIAGQLAAKGYTVVLACRNQERGEAAAQALKERYGSDLSVYVELLDLASFASVRSFAAAIRSRHSRLDLLVCNAGLEPSSIPQEKEKQLTDDGADLCYQTNYLSHFLLTLMLLPLLQATSGARVINLSSIMHRHGLAKDLEDTRRMREPYTSLYGLSKLAQLSSSFEFHRRFAGTGVVFHNINPGGVASDIWRAWPKWKQCVFDKLFISTEAAAATVVRACLCEEGRAPSPPQYWNGYRGAECCQAFEYWSPCAARDTLVASTPSDLATDPAFATNLWEESIAALRAGGVGVSLEGSVQA